MADKPPISNELSKRFLEFSRNGRWGTCADCFRDTQGNVYPEFCKNTVDNNHQLTVDYLAKQFKRYKS